LHPDLVVTIQPGEMVFTTPAPLSLPNRAGYEAGTEMDLWSINPTTGDFDKVGTGRVSDDGSVIETIEGGIRNSSWHFFTPPPPQPSLNPLNEDDKCNECKANAPTNSEVELHSGAVMENHDLVSYQSLGATRGLSLNYDSNRANPNHIVHFSDTNFTGSPTPVLIAQLSVSQGRFSYQVPGFVGTDYDLRGGERLWLPPESGTIDASFEADLSSLPSGQYKYEIDTGFRQFTGEIFAGASATVSGSLSHVNSINSIFGSGWGLAGLQSLVENVDRSILLIDGDGSEIFFSAPESGSQTYISPDGDFSTLEKLSDGTFVRTLKDQTVYTFNAQKLLTSVRDANGNETQYLYDSNNKLSQIIDPVGLSTTFTYTGERVSQITDPMGRVTTLEYDAAGNLLSVTDPDSTSRTWEYDDRHLMVAEVDKRGEREETVYDAAGRATKAITKDGSLIQVNPVQTEGLYQLEENSDPFNIPVARGLVFEGALEDYKPIASYADGNGNVTQTLLDQAGQAVESSDGEGFLPFVERDENNLVTTRLNGRGNQTDYTYDERGNLLTVKDEISQQSSTPTSNNLFPNRIYPAVGGVAVTGDVNGDGSKDLVSAELESSSISVLLGDGEGSFGETTDLDLGDSISSLDLKDLDNDGNLDLIVGVGGGYGGDSSVSVRLGNGDGSFALGNNYEVGSAAKTILIEDLNNDGQLDVVATVETGVSVLLGNGDGSFGERNEFSLNSEPNTLTLGDLNGDALLDLVTTNFDSISVLLNNGDGTFASSIDYAVAEETKSVTLGDLNGDGRLDAVTANISSVSVLLNNGDGTFAVTVDYFIERFPEQLVMAQLNGDSALDVVFIDNLNQSVSVLFNNGDGTLASNIDYALPSNPSSVAVGDLNGDGLADIITSNFDSFNSNRGKESSSVSVLLNNGDGTLAEAINYVVGSGPNFLTLEDFNGDSFVDVLTGNSNSNSYDRTSSISVLLGNGDGSLQATRAESAHVSVSVGEFPVAVELVDLNLDSVLDLVTANQVSDTLSVALGNGDGSFSATLDYPVEDLPSDLTSADFNGDGNPDVVVVDFLNDRASILLGNGDGSLSNKTDYTTGARPTAVITFDVNGDGNNDLITANSFANSVSILFGNGDGTFASPTNIAVDSRPVDVSQGDVNGDGVIDLVTANANSNSVSVLLGNGSGSFASRTNFVLESSPRSITIADVDGDGIVDLVTANSFDNSVSVLLGNGDGSFASPTNISVGEQPVSVVSGDVNGDELIDLITTNTEDDSVSVLLGSNSSFKRLDFQVGDAPNSIALGDLEADGDLDLAVANQFSNTVSLVFNTTADSGGSTTGTGEQVYTYDPIFNKVTSMVDELGRQTIYEIDPNTGNTLAMIRVVGTLGGDDDVVTRYTYTDTGLIDTEIDPLGRVTDYDYDARGRTIRLTYAVGTPDEAQMQYEYDDAGNQTAVIDENGVRTEFEYDELNRLIKTIYAVGTSDEAVEQIEYDAVGNQIATIDANGNRTEYVYDEIDRLIKTTEADPDADGVLSSPITTNAYDPFGNLVSVVDPLGRETKYVYDSRNRSVKTIQPDRSQEISQYDLDNNNTSSIDANGNRTNQVYDARGRLIREVDALGNVTRFEYDAANQLVAQIDANGNRTEYEYDELGRQIATIDAEGNISRTEYDEVGNTISSVDGNGNQTSYTYDARNRQILVTDALNGNTVTTYDSVGNVISITDPVGNTTTFAYDARNRLTSETNELGATRSHAYDLLGRLIVVDNAGTPNIPNVVLTYTYDDNGNLLSVSDEIDGEAAGTTAYTIDEIDRVVSITQSGNGVAQKRVDMTYNPISQYSSLSRYADLNGTQLVAETSYSYDSANRLTNLTHNNSNSTVAFYDFVYDEANRITQVSDVEGTTDYSYDATNQLTEADRNNVNNPDESYSYDENGNRTNSGYTTGTNNQLLSDGTYNYEYDGEGNLIRQTQIATGELREFEWDYRNRLVAVVDKDDSGNLIQEVSFTYDAMNRRLSKTVDENPNDGVDGVVTYFVYDQYNVILEFVDLDGVLGSTEAFLDKRYLYGNRVDQILAQEESINNVFWHLTNHLGTVYDLVDNSGKSINHLSYDSFGNVIFQTNPTVDNHYLFTGREFDSETGLYYYRARYFNPEIGRFIEEDPIEFASGDTNFYRYVGNSPLDRTDPSGMFSYLDYNDAVPLTVGNCGYYFWKIRWQIGGDANELIQGFVIQKIVFHVNIDKCPNQTICPTPPPVPIVRQNGAFWEAWEVKNGKVYNPGGGQGTDTFSIGEFPVGFSGDFETQGWAKYIPNFQSAYNWKPGTAEQSGNLPSTTIPPEGWSEQNSIYRKVSGQFNCCQGSQKTKVKRKVIKNQIKI
jgi:RHS repeat-associated protein